ncbi:hypothetical protein GRAN_1573 [Granulicella sibirica]|uniref:DUF4199 domain-containing protein n=1 Tax=Granulicella sibirica TaxID=2479048 RepID=A0A4Q0T3S1_9BACT|nr:hypothetical protein GRAN_1573 [Granulicella sibirica]
MGSAGESTFCPHCGAPQLRVLEENVVVARIEASDGRASTGALPPPHPGRVRWGTVTVLAAGVSAVAAVLMVGVMWLPVAFPLAWLWTVCGAVVVLAIYQRRHPETLITAGTGARVGLVYGLMAVTSLAAVIAIGGLVARFGLHAMGSIDLWLTNAMQQAVVQQKDSGVQITEEQLKMFYSAEMRAGMALFLLAVSGTFLVGFSALGGAIGGMLRMRRTRA